MLVQLSARKVFFISSCVLRKLSFSTHYSMKNPDVWRLTATTLQNFYVLGGLPAAMEGLHNSPGGLFVHYYMHAHQNAGPAVPSQAVQC